MEIRPTTIVKLFSGVPLDNTYTDTLYFASKSAQSAYFNSLTPVKTFTSQMYQRVNKGQFEANCKADDIYNCNYMAFQNSGFGDKWFYAFINSVEYINNNNSLVTFEIDVMQTWMFDCELEMCFIERQHSVNDVIGENILPEPLATGEYVFSEYQILDSRLNQYAIMVATVEVDNNAEENPVVGRVYDNVYGGVELKAYQTDSLSVDYLNIQLGSYIQRPETVINLYMCPKVLLPSFGELHTGKTIPDDYEPEPLTIVEDTITDNDNFEGYIPKNKKLYTYPYNFYHIDDGDGNSLECRYEFFNDLTPRFLIEGCITSPVQLKISPLNYKTPMLSGAYVNLRTESLCEANYPICSWNYDNYRAWVAQNSIPLAYKGAGVALGLGLGLITGGVGLVAAAGTGIASIVNMMSQSYHESIKADVCRGNTNTGNVNFARKKNTFYGGRCHVTAQYARMIDHFFTMYGYAYKKYGIPNTHSRPHWNYVKTNGCKIIGQCPADDNKKICKIYDDGITFWKNASEVGNYNLDNSPT